LPENKDRDSNNLNATVRWTVARPRLDGDDTLRISLWEIRYRVRSGLCPKGKRVRSGSCPPGQRTCSGSPPCRAAANIYSLKNDYKLVTIRPVFARQILKRRSARCSSSLAATAAIMTAAPSGRFSARFVVSAANTVSIRPCFGRAVSLCKNLRYHQDTSGFYFNIPQASAWMWSQQLYPQPEIFVRPESSDSYFPGRQSLDFSEPAETVRR